jgi:hypothetical protein
MNRRGFLAGILALAAAPAIVKASSLMKISAPTDSGILIHEGNYVLDLNPEGLNVGCLNGWPYKTSEEVLRDVNELITQVWADYSVAPAYIIVPDHVYQALREENESRSVDPRSSPGGRLAAQLRSRMPGRRGRQGPPSRSFEGRRAKAA